MDERGQAAITDVEFETAFNESLDLVNDQVKTNHPKQLWPLLQIITRREFEGELSQVVIIMADLPEAIEDRHKTFEAVGAKCMAEANKFGAPVAIIFSTEAWVKKLENKDYEKFQAAGKRVSEYDDKQEMVVTAARTIDERRAYAMHDIERYAKKKAIKQLNLTQYAPYKGQAKQPFDSSLLDSFYRGAYKVVIGKEI